MTSRRRFALTMLIPWAIAASSAITRAQLPPVLEPPALGEPSPPAVPIPPAEPLVESPPTQIRDLIGQALRGAIEASRLQVHAGNVAVVPSPTVTTGPRGTRINVPGVRINLPGVQIGPQPPVLVAGPPSRALLADIVRRSWEIIDHLFQAVAPAAREQPGMSRLLLIAQNYATALRNFNDEPALSPAEAADVARLNHAVLDMLDASALERLAETVGPKGPPADDLRALATVQASEALQASQIPPGLVLQANGQTMVSPGVRPNLILLGGSARELVTILHDLEPALPRTIPAPAPPSVPNR